MATQGYGGEFSSDEDIDRIEQDNERAKLDPYTSVKPSKNQIDEAIETIRRAAPDQELSLSDELLAALLDHYKTQRGPIVDSTRNLYKKIVFRLIRGEQQQQQSQPIINGDSTKHIKSTMSNNNNVAISASNNNNNNDVANKQTEAASSDEDEPMPPASSQSSVEQSVKRRLDGRNADADKVEPMDVDSEGHRVEIRDTKKDISSSESENDEDDEGDDDSDVVDITPVKGSTHQAPALKTSTPIVARQEAKAKLSVAKEQQQEEPTSYKKKPFTRSQRVVATRSSTKDRRTGASPSKAQVETAASAIAAVHIGQSSSIVKLAQVVRPMVTTKRLAPVDAGESLARGTLDGRKLNYAEKMVLNMLIEKKSATDSKSRPRASR